MATGWTIQPSSWIVRRVKPKELHLPSQAQFQEMATHIETSGAGQAKDCANLFRFLAFSGVRIDEARHVLWSDVDFEKGLLHVRVTKNSKARWIPLNSSLRQLLEKMRAEQPEELPDKPVMQVFECQKSIDRAAKLAGVKRITHHDLRHLFATRCIESGVDIPTVSRWLGHQDGGALCMKTYGHLRDEHSTNEAKRSHFNHSQAVNLASNKKSRNPCSWPGRACKRASHYRHRDEHIRYQ